MTQEESVMMLVKLRNTEVPISEQDHPVCCMCACHIGPEDPSAGDPLIYEDRPIHTHCTGSVNWNKLCHMSGQQVNTRLLSRHNQSSQSLVYRALVPQMDLWSAVVE